MVSTSSDKHTERFERALWTAARKLGPEMADNLSIPLTRQQVFMLYFISNKGVCKVSDLAETMEVKPSAITVMIDRLIKHDVARRRHDAKDRRVVLIELTDRGRQLLEELKERRRHIIGQYLADVPSGKLESFLDVFEQIVDNITKAHTASPHPKD